MFLTFEDLIKEAKIRAEKENTHFQEDVYMFEGYMRVHIKTAEGVVVSPLPDFKDGVLKKVGDFFWDGEYDIMAWVERNALCGAVKTCHLKIAKCDAIRLTKVFNHRKLTCHVRAKIESENQQMWLKDFCHIIFDCPVVGVEVYVADSKADLDMRMERQKDMLVEGLNVEKVVMRRIVTRKIDKKIDSTWPEDGRPRKVLRIKQGGI